MSPVGYRIRYPATAIRRSLSPAEIRAAEQYDATILTKARASLAKVADLQAAQSIEDERLGELEHDISLLKKDVDSKSRQVTNLVKKANQAQDAWKKASADRAQKQKEWRTSMRKRTESVRVLTTAKQNLKKIAAKVEGVPISWRNACYNPEDEDLYDAKVGPDFDRIPLVTRARKDVVVVYLPIAGGKYRGQCYDQKALAKDLKQRKRHVFNWVRKTDPKTGQPYHDPGPADTERYRTDHTKGDHGRPGTISYYLLAPSNIVLTAEAKTAVTDTTIGTVWLQKIGVNQRIGTKGFGQSEHHGQLPGFEIWDVSKTRDRRFALENYWLQMAGATSPQWKPVDKPSEVARDDPALGELLAPGEEKGFVLEELEDDSDAKSGDDPMQERSSSSDWEGLQTGQRQTLTAAEAQQAYGEGAGLYGYGGGLEFGGGGVAPQQAQWLEERAGETAEEQMARWEAAG